MAIVFLNLAQNLMLGVNKPFHLYSHSFKGTRFDFELHGCEHPLIELPMRLEIGWDNNLLEVEYDSLVEESYSALVAYVGDIYPSFMSYVDDVNLPHLVIAYKTDIRL